MGVWAAGLYSSDEALDLKASVRAMSRLPLNGPQLLAMLRAESPQADDRRDEQHTTFWLVTADQFARCGIVCPEARDRALEIIQNNADLDMMRSLEMSRADLRKRETQLRKLAVTLQEPVTAKRRTLTEPEPLLLPAGSIWRYPTMNRKSRNPYFASAAQERFVANGWGALVTLAVGRAFDWLAWYAVAPIALRKTDDIAMVDVAAGRFYLQARSLLAPDEPPAILGGVGTLTPAHVKRLSLEPIGQCAINADKVLGGDVTARGRQAVVNDISLSNYLDAAQCTADGPQLADFLPPH